MNKKQHANNIHLKQPAPNRYRHVRPDRYQSTQFADLSLTARVAITGMPMFSDKNGNFEWDVRMLKVKVMPHDVLNFADVLAELLAHGEVTQYTVAGKLYGHVTYWQQYIDNHEAKAPAVYPEPLDGPQPPNNHQYINQTDSTTFQNVLERSELGAHPLQNSSVGVGVSVRSGEEKGVGKGSESAPVPGSALADKKTEPVNIEPKDDSPKPISSLSDRTSPDPKPAGMKMHVVGPALDAMPTIGDIPTESLDGMLSVISDGLFETGALKNYSETDTLEQACRETIQKFGSFPMTDRLALARIVSEVMNVIERESLSWPPGFKPVIAALRAGGERQLYVPLKQRRTIIYGDVLCGASAFSFYRAAMEPDKELLQPFADIHGVPQNFGEAVEFLQRVEEDLQSRNDSLPEDLETVYAKLQERAADGVPTRLIGAKL